MKWSRFTASATALVFAVLGTAAQAQGDSLIRKNLGERIPQLQKIDEVRKAEMPGLWEVRVGTDVFYTDSEGNFLISGQLIDTKSRRNLTEERVDKLSAIDFSALPLADAFTIVRGDGKRKLAVFEDPNCPYCKRFERDLQKVDNVTIYMFLYPILGPDSIDKSHHIWCAKDRGKAWVQVMVENRPLTPASCDTAPVERNVAFGHKHKITGTPTLLFTDGKRVPGAISAADVDKMLSAAK